MRILLMVLALGACMDSTEPAPDDAPLENNLGVPIGERCDRTIGLVCGDGSLGACIEGACVAQCSAVAYPRCGAGLTERHVQLDANTMVCVCD